MGHAAKQKHEGGARAGQGVHEYAGGARWRLVDAGNGEGKARRHMDRKSQKKMQASTSALHTKATCELITDLSFKMQATHTPMVPYLHTPKTTARLVRRREKT
jgi:hypothetical protein